MKTAQPSTPLAISSDNLRIKAKMILEELEQLFAQLDFEQLDKAIQLIHAAERIFFMGAGRTGLALKAIAMRFMHLGYPTFVVGETTTPAIGIGDLLIAGSGSGTTSSIVRAAEKATLVSANVMAFSTTTASPLSTFATHTVVLAAAQKEDHHNMISNQYAGSLFEQGLFLLGDTIVQALWKTKDTAPEQLWKRHANLE